MKKIYFIIPFILFTLMSCYKNEQAATTASTDSSNVVQDNSGKRVLYWYDPMTPGQKFDKPGKSPITPKPDAANTATIRIKTLFKLFIIPHFYF